jgi:hypothetical protein
MSPLIDLEIADRPLFYGFGLALLLIMMGSVGALGARYTPVTGEGMPQVLTWTEWQVYLRRAAYQTELQHLQRETERLADLLQRPPDPVRVQLILEQQNRKMQEGDPALEPVRQALLQTGEIVQAWAQGRRSHETAVAAHTALVETLQRWEQRDE